MGWFDSWLIPSTDWIQIEVSTVCNAECVYCPGTAHRDAWRSRFMTRETFAKILPALTKTKLAYLQGWGEPFLHPDILTFIALAKRAGCSVGATTNGMELDNETLRKVVDAGVDIVAFSLAGTGETNDKLRRKTRFDTIVETIRRLHRIKQEANASHPAIHIAYMLLRSGLGDLNGLTPLLSGLNVDQAVVTTLPYAPSSEMESETIHDLPPTERLEIQTRLHKIADEAKEKNVSLFFYLDDIEKCDPSCTENVERSAFVSVTGEISPCVFAGLPIEGVYGPPLDGFVHRRMVFGDINRQSFGKIWNQKNYREFRKSFGEGRVGRICLDCPKRRETLR